jgi:hypothetical protein
VLFQTLDNKEECVGIYCNDELIFDVAKFPDSLSTTWSYHPSLQSLNVEYASLYLEGGRMEEYIPEYLQEEWEDVFQKLKAFKRSLKISQVNSQENCFYDLVPDRFLIDYCSVKNRITQHIINSVPRPPRYKFYKAMAEMLGEISSHSIDLDQRHLRSLMGSPKLKSHAASLLGGNHRVEYNPFGTITGRLTTKKNSFPILTLNKVFRPAVRPTNDFYMEIDFNGAEVRTLLGLSGHSQPQGDVHDFHLKNVFTDLSTRAEAKTAFFAWMYGAKGNLPQAQRNKLEEYYDKREVLRKFWVEGNVVTPYRKVIQNVDEHHALNYIVQSVAAELTLKQALKINYLLKKYGSGSHIAFLIHDAVVIDIKQRDLSLLPDIVGLMESTDFGKFKTNVKKGLNLGSLEVCRG